jgi:thioredoxin-dependent peroxiredoxin
MALGTHLKRGDAAPSFTAHDQNGTLRSLTDFKGSKLILFFYPEDDTSVCNVQNCNISDHYPDLRQRGYEVYGVSPDSIESHQKFINKFSLKQPLLADPERKMMTDYGVYGEKLMYGKTITGVHRTTFVIDEQGKIHTVITGVRSKIATDQILKKIAETEK